MNYKKLNDSVGNTDLYLLDQILKGRFVGLNDILDAGAGEGRNLKYFANNGYNIHAVDKNPNAIKMLKMLYTKHSPNFITGDLKSMPWPKESFDAIICSAVMHFAANEDEFDQMFSEVMRVLRPNGLCFIRMAGDFCPVVHPEAFTYVLASEKWLSMLQQHSIELIEPLKTVLVGQKRAMSTIVFLKKPL